jgi:hypothetical protein
VNHLNWKRTVQEFLADKAETPVRRLWDTKVGQLGEFLCGVSSYFISPAGGGPTRLAIALRVQRGFLFLNRFYLGGDCRGIVCNHSLRSYIDLQDEKKTTVDQSWSLLR